MRCQANQNGSQVECDLGNPVKRNSKVRQNCVFIVKLNKRSKNIFKKNFILMFFPSAEIFHQSEHS